MAKKWERSEAVVAQRIGAAQLGGMFSKHVRVMEREVALVERDGKAIRSFEHGDHKVAGMFSGPDRNVVFVDLAPHTITREVKGLWTKDDKEVVAAVELRFVVSDPEKFASEMLRGKDVVMNEDLWDQVEGDVSASVMAPVVKKMGMDQLTGDEKAAKDLQVSAEVGLRKRLTSIGLELMSFTVRFVLPEAYQDMLRKRGMMKQQETERKAGLEAETEQAVHDREMGEIAGTVRDKERALDELEQERVSREGEMELEEEETQHDMRDAMEALKLKEIKDKQETIRDSERHELGLSALKEGSASPDKGRLEQRYEELQRVMDQTQKKYLNRKVDKDTFKRMMNDYEKEKTELQVKLEKSGKEKGKKPGDEE